MKIIIFIYKYVGPVCLMAFALTSGNTMASGQSKAPVELKKGGAVTAFVKEDGFKLSPRAIKNLDVAFETLQSEGPWSVSKSSLVRIKNSVGVYRKYDGWITLVLVNVLNSDKKMATIKSVDLQSGDEIAISGVTFLRMTDADLNSETVDACAH